MHLNKIKSFLFILPQAIYQGKRTKSYITLQGIQFENVHSKLERN